MAQETTLRFAITGMDCGSCALLIDDTVKDQPGVSRTETSYSMGETVITVDLEVADVEAIAEAIRKEGFGVRKL